ncbi:MAG: twin-arginine translocase subunit TatC [Deltaproteobacteria bacterium]|nr:twin-arginine translocase subunit TatC [Deltaproteobacteria bacterium]MBN2673350.1 twin-arginine translocase subunit TatC [Deltaproteobacteria bacterium]
MTFLEHLEELRQRLIKCILAVVVGIFICWFFREELRQFLEAPLYTAWKSVPGLPAPSPLSFKSLMEPFVAYLKISAIGGVFFASPVIFYHLWRFISPGLYKKEKKIAFPFVIISSALFIVGAAGAYTYVFPIGFSFFLQFSSGGTVEHLETQPLAVLQASADRNDGTTSADTGSKTKSAEKSERTPDKKMNRKSAGTVKSPKRSEQKDKWAKLFAAYQWVEAKLVGENCGRLRGVSEPKGVQLIYRFDSKRCGEAPSSIRVFKDERPINLEMIVSASENGITTYKAFDRKATSHPSVYRVTVVHAAAQKLAPVLMVKDYLDFAIKLLLAFGLVFELPVLIFFLAYAGIVDYRQLIGFGRWFIVFSVTFAAIITPPDVVTQIMLATPLVILYYLSILVVFFLGKKRSTDE